MTDTFLPSWHGTCGSCGLWITSLDAWARRLVLLDGLRDDGTDDDGVGESVEVASLFSLEFPM